MRCNVRHLLVAAALALGAMAPVHALVLIRSSDLSITKNISDPAPYVGDSVTFTINIANAGPADATGTTVTDTLPTTFSYSSFTSSVLLSSFSCNVSNVCTWSVGTLSLNSPATLQLFGTVTTAGSFTNTASITSSSTDPNTSNNTASVAFRVQERATTVPEPGSLALLALGLMGLGISRRRRA